MTKNNIRVFFKKLLIDKPKEKWRAQVKVWDRAIVLGWGAILWISATATGNAGILLFLIFMAVLGLGIMYYTARGR